jgi:uncharacterized protein
VIGMWEDLAQYIMENYTNTDKIVEVGVGNFHKVALILEEHFKIDIIMTDIKPSHSMIILDDIAHPNLKIYKDATLIYAIRPPPELQPHLLDVARKVGADLIIKPFSTELINLDTNMDRMEMVNYKKATFYKMCSDEMARTQR